MKYNYFIDHTLLKADATNEQFDKLCNEAKEYGFASVCVNPSRVKYCYELLKDSDVKVCTVVGFPLGATSTFAKVQETKRAVKDGAKEIDMVINIGMLKDQDYKYVLNDIKAVRKVSPFLKVIIETCLLTDDEKVKACLLAKEAKADFVKTSTGFSTGGATKEDIALMRKTVGPNIGVKASGGIKTYEEMLSMIENGATRIGTSRGVDLCK